MNDSKLVSVQIFKRGDSVGFNEEEQSKIKTSIFGAKLKRPFASSCTFATFLSYGLAWCGLGLSLSLIAGMPTLCLTGQAGSSTKLLV